jgi:hypothetical protein
MQGDTRMYACMHVFIRNTIAFLLSETQRRRQPSPTALYCSFLHCLGTLIKLDTAVRDSPYYVFIFSYQVFI